MAIDYVLQRDLELRALKKFLIENQDCDFEVISNSNNNFIAIKQNKLVTTYNTVTKEEFIDMWNSIHIDNQISLDNFIERKYRYEI